MTTKVCLLLIVVGCPGGLAAAQAVIEPGKPVLRVEPLQLKPNLLPNGSFENVADGSPEHWQWHQRNTDATMSVDQGVAHSGTRSVRITNGTPIGPEVYATLQLAGGMAVRPETTYTFSCYVKGHRIGIAWFGGGRDRHVRARAPHTTDGRWVRVVVPFVTGPGITNSPVVLVTEDPSRPFWVDDVQLVEGPQAMPVFAGQGTEAPVLELGLPAPEPVQHRGRSIPRRWNPTHFPRHRYLFAARNLSAHGWLYLPRGLADCTLAANLTSADGRTLGAASREGKLQAGMHLISFGCSTAGVPGGDVRLRIGLKDDSAEAPGPARVEADLRRRLITSADARKVLGRVETLRGKLRERVESFRRAGRDPAYLLATLTVLKNFIGFTQEDLNHDELARAYDVAIQMEAMAQRALKRKFLPPVPRYVTAPTGRSFRLEGAGQLGTVRWFDGRAESDRLLQFVGVGHFDQVKRDIEQLNNYGCNIIQVEFGPSSVLTGDDQISTATIDQYLKLFDRAAKANVTVNLLISPHYFPQWAYEKWPHLAEAGGGFLKVDVYAPEARAVYEKFLRTVIPRIRDHTALHSICLSNEPVFTEVEKSRYVREKWHRWLRDEHGTIEALNQRWGSEYAGFESIGVVSLKELQPSPIAYDFVRFNREAFAEFHAWMASIIRELAPDIPLHAKIMICNNVRRRRYGPWSISPELFAAVGQYNGNDAWKNYRSRGEWVSHWQRENMGYDFQRSMADKPVFNSENHLIADRDFDYVPAAHIANIFWQGAIHGQSATTTWVWERTYSRTSDCAGSILHRPQCVEAMGQTGLDLMRLANEVAAFQQLPVEVTLLWSPASIVAGQEYLDRVVQMYEALNFCGVRLGFVTERQLSRAAETGRLPAPLENVKLIIAAGVTHTPESTTRALQKFQRQGGKVVCVGPCFTHNEYGRPQTGNDGWTETFEPPATPREAFDFIQGRSGSWAVQPAVELRTAQGQPAWGVEHLAVRHSGKLLVNLTNYLRQPQRLSVLADGKVRGAVDLLSGQAIRETFELPSLRPMLLVIE